MTQVFFGRKCKTLCQRTTKPYKIQMVVERQETFLFLTPYILLRQRVFPLEPHPFLLIFTIDAL